MTAEERSTLIVAGIRDVLKGYPIQDLEWKAVHLMVMDALLDEQEAEIERMKKMFADQARIRKECGL